MVRPLPKLRARSNSGDGLDEMQLTVREQKNSGDRIDDTTLKFNKSSPSVKQSYLRRRIRQWTIQWELLSPTAKWLRRGALGVLLLVLLMDMYDHFVFTDKSFSRQRIRRGQQDAFPILPFAVVINTYKRPLQLRQAVRHYAVTHAKASGIAQVFVVWAEVGVPPVTVEELLQGADSSTAVPIQVIQASKDSLNSRFLPIPALEYDCVFMVDDDLVVDETTLQMAVRAWKGNPDKMVGFYPRLALLDPHTTKPSYLYHSFPKVWLRQEFNFVLTKAALLHRKYLDLYSNHMPSVIKDYVDQHHNCEDVAMACLVANATVEDSSAIYVEPTHFVHDDGLFSGISTAKSDHFIARSACLTDITSMYGEQGWSPPFNKGFPISENSAKRHWQWWQYGPANIFEWCALQNVWK